MILKVNSWLKSFSLNLTLKPYCMRFVMDVKEVRRLNLIYLIDTVGKVAELSSIIGLDNPNYISQLKSNNNRKAMGDQFARRIEVAFKKPLEWMDSLQSTGNIRALDALKKAVSNVLANQKEIGNVDLNNRIDTDLIAGLVVGEHERNFD